MPACANVALSTTCAPGIMFCGGAAGGNGHVRFTDIEGSTELLDNFSAEAFKEALVTSPTCKLDPPRAGRAPALTEHPSQHAYRS